MDVNWGRGNEGDHPSRPIKEDTAARPRAHHSTSKPKKTKQKTEFTILYGTASPPTSYGGYGGNAQETAK